MYAQAQAVPIVGSVVSGVEDHLHPRKPFDPLPPSFLRPVNRSRSFTPFDPIVLYSSLSGADMTAGLLKSSRPFAIPPRLPSHDVEAADWDRFLHDLDITTRIGAGPEVFAIGLPVVLGLNFFLGNVVQKKVEDRFKPGQVGPGLQFIERWNREFFAPRDLDV